MERAGGAAAKQNPAAGVGGPLRPRDRGEETEARTERGKFLTPVLRSFIPSCAGVDGRAAFRRRRPKRIAGAVVSGRRFGSLGDSTRVGMVGPDCASSR